MKHIAIIPARSGSKGLKDKNIKLLNGKPLLAYSIEAAINSGIFDTVMVSTDSNDYAEVAKKYGAEVPFLRSKETSGDKASSWDTVSEVLTRYDERGENFDTVCLLQPTSPLRTAQDIKKAYELFDLKKADSITSVCEVDHSPLWCNTLPETLSMKGFINLDIKGTGRQSLLKYFRINGALYIRKIIYEKSITIMDDNSFAFIMDKSHSVDIDEEYDFYLASYMLSDYHKIKE